MDIELEQFKTDINLIEYATGQGYSIDRRRSTRTSAVLRHDSGHKIVVSVEAGRWIYFSIGDEKDAGSILDFVMNRAGISLGRARVVLRGWLGLERTAKPLQSPPTLKRRSIDRQSLARAYDAFSPIEPNDYLNSRDISCYLDPCFAGSIRVNNNNEVVFPHFDAEGLCGYERKGIHGAYFSAGGTHGLWRSDSQASDRDLLVAESPIDAMSVFELKQIKRSRLLATSGSLSARQIDLVIDEAKKLERPKLFIAFDADESGDAMAERLIQAYPSSFVQRLRPPAKDWNEALKGASRLAARL